MVEDETAKHEAIMSSNIVVGTKVLHKSGGSAKRGADARQGVVRRVYTVTKKGKPVVKCAVDWPAPNRINGDGWHRSDVLASSLVIASVQEVERRRALNRAINARNQERARQMAATIDAELATQGFRLAHGHESRLPEARNIRLSNGCNVWVLPMLVS